MSLSSGYGAYACSRHIWWRRHVHISEHQRHAWRRAAGEAINHCCCSTLPNETLFLHLHLFSRSSSQECRQNSSHEYTHFLRSFNFLVPLISVPFQKLKQLHYELLQDREQWSPTTRSTQNYHDHPDHHDHPDYPDHPDHLNHPDHPESCQQRNLKEDDG